MNGDPGELKGPALRRAAEAAGVPVVDVAIPALSVPDLRIVVVRYADRTTHFNPQPLHDAYERVTDILETADVNGVQSIDVMTPDMAAKKYQIDLVKKTYILAKDETLPLDGESP